jgi:hypothetical protein
LRRSAGLFFGFIILIFTNVSLARDLLVDEWRGNGFMEDHGGFYIRVSLKDFPASEQTTFMTTPIKFFLKNIETNNTHVFSHGITEVAFKNQQIWTLPVGRYRLSRIELIDLFGVKRSWSPIKEVVFTIKNRSISNFGFWLIRPWERAELFIGYKPTKNSYTESNSKEDSMVMEVIDGLTGASQEVFSGKNGGIETESPFGRKEVLSNIKSKRQIAMYYTLNLGRQNRQSQKIIRVIDVNDGAIRQCYLDLLNQDAKAKGNVKFSFLISKKTGVMQRITYGGGSLKKDTFLKCMTNSLGHLQFPVRESMLGELAFTFNSVVR